jgi:hypothetical protein
MVMAQKVFLKAYGKLAVLKEVSVKKIRCFVSVGISYGAC